MIGTGAFYFNTDNMAKEKSKEKKLKRLYNQLNKLQDQPEFRPAKKDGKTIPGKFVMTRNGRIQQKILTLQNTK